MFGLPLCGGFIHFHITYSIYCHIYCSLVELVFTLSVIRVAELKPLP